MIRPPTRSKRTDTLFPYTTLFRSARLSKGYSNLSSGSGNKHFHQQLIRSQYLRLLRNQIPTKNQIRSCWMEPLFTIRLRSEEHTSELQSLMRISYAVFCLKKKNKHK